jgi:hypothetical protein
MLPILLACAIWLPALVGLGIPLSGFLRRLGGSASIGIAERTALCGFLGMFTASVLAAAANLIVPIYPVVSSAILISGWLLVIVHRQLWLRLPCRGWRLAGIIFITTVFIDARGRAWYDTGLYHMQAVRWITQGPLPRGLANLDGRLGFNSAWFTLAASLETPLLLGKSCFVVNAILTMLVALPALGALLRMPGRPIRSDRVVLALMLIPLALFGVDVGMISSLSPDLVIIVLTMFLLALWVRDVRFAPQIAVLACFAVSIKLSAVPLLIFPSIIGSIWARRGISNRRSIFALGIFLAVAVTVFTIRGIWLSGYPAYPSLIGKLSEFKWTVPARQVVDQAKSIEVWAKYQQPLQAVARGTPWIARWFEKFGTSGAMLVAFAIFTTGTALWMIRRPRGSSATVRALVAIVALLPGLGFWFLEAPQIRFGYSYLFGIAALSLAIGTAGIVPNLSRHRWSLSVSVALVVLLIVSRIDRQFLKVRPFSWPEIPHARLSAHHLKGGITIWTPIGSDQVWNAPQLVTSQLNPRLQCEKDASGRPREFWIDPNLLARPARFFAAQASRPDLKSSLLRVPMDKH